MLDYDDFWLLLRLIPVKQTAAALCWGSAGARPRSRLMFDGCFADRGELFVWGKNVRGCLGIGKRDDQFFPWRVRRHWFNISRANKRVETMQADVLCSLWAWKDFFKYVKYTYRNIFTADSLQKSLKVIVINSSIMCFFGIYSVWKRTFSGS